MLRVAADEIKSCPVSGQLFCFYMCLRLPDCAKIVICRKTGSPERHCFRGRQANRVFFLCESPHFRHFSDLPAISARFRLAMLGSKASFGGGVASARAALFYRKEMKSFFPDFADSEHRFSFLVIPPGSGRIPHRKAPVKTPCVSCFAGGVCQNGAFCLRCKKLSAAAGR